MEFKYKVGDKVLVKENLSSIHGFTGGYIGSSMDEYSGKTVIIRETLDFYDKPAYEIDPDKNGFTWDERAFEPLPVIEIDSDGIKVNGNVCFTTTAIDNSEYESLTTISDKNSEMYDWFEKNIKNKKGDIDMNKVLELYKDKKNGEICKKYEEKEKEFIEKIEVLNEYSYLIETFEKNMEDLFESTKNLDHEYLVETYDDNLYKYKVNGDLVDELAREEFEDEKMKEINDLTALVREVNAQLSLSDDLDYQIDVLIRYNILDKKTKKLVD